MKEKTRPKEKEKPIEESIESETRTDEVVDVTEEEESEVQHTPVVTVETKTTEVSEIEEKTVQQTTAPFVEELLPPWGTPDESEWMYGIPPREEDQILWAEEWADFLLQWTKHFAIHIISVATFISEPPFKDLRNKVDSFKMIAQVLIDKEIAEWIDKRKRQLRVYWKPLEDWADSIYAWAIKTGKLRLDVKSIVIQESAENFATLPERDLHFVLALMVEKELAEWVDKDKGAIVVTI